jgi:CPA1 family monovalent cation:H+ antiporter
VLTFLLNATLFLLIGLQLNSILDGLSGYSTGELLGYAGLVSGTVIVMRIAWSFTTPYLIRALDRRESQRERRVGAATRMVAAWSGMRGAVSLAAALALPLETDAGAPLPQRDLILFLTFAVILATLVGQGLTLPLIIRLLRLEEDGKDEREDAKARIHAAEAALARLEELIDEEWVREDTAERMRGAYRFRTNRFQARLDDGDDGSIESRSQDYQRLRRELLDAERRALIELRRSGMISNDVWLRVGRDLDLEDQRLDI